MRFVLPLLFLFEAIPLDARIPKEGVSPLVLTEYGAVHGYSNLSTNGSEVKIFKGIPYAKPPIGELRWKLPETPTPWLTPLSAQKYRSACWGNSSITGDPEKEMSEDCLYLNIFTSPQCMSTSSCPVAVFFHGGDMVTGSAVGYNDSYMVEHFAAQGIVLILPAFRLGFAHALNFNDNHKIVPSNLGVHDAHQALRFVRNNIASFGGDSQKLTLYGHSYGGALSLALAYSPIVQKEISFISIIAMSPYARFRSEDLTLRNTNTLIDRTNCRKEGIQETVNCMRKIDAKRLSDIQHDIEVADHTVKSFGGISITRPLLPFDSMEEMLRYPPKASLLIGSTVFEFDSIPMNHGEGLGEMFGLENALSVEDAYEALSDANLIKKHHSTDTNSIVLSVHLFAESIARTESDVFVYSYDQPKNNAHTQDLSLILGPQMFDLDENETIIAALYPSLFSSFIKSGTPTDKWSRWNDRHKHYSIAVNITNGRFPSMHSDYEEENIRFWTESAPKVDRLISKAKLQGNADLRYVTVPPTEQIAVHHNLISISLAAIALCFILVVIATVAFWRRERRHRYASL